MVNMQEIFGKMSLYLNNFSQDQMNNIQAALFMTLNGYDISEKKEEETHLTIANEDNKGYMMFFVSKKIEGRSPRTITYYKNTIDAFLQRIPKPLAQYATDDIRYYLAVRQSQDCVSNTTINNERRILSSFFGWLSAEEYIPKNICSPIKQIKTKKQKKKAFSEVELLKIRDACNSFGNKLKKARTKALVEFFISTGCRAGEVATLTRENIDLEAGEATVTGKGNKERVVYLNQSAKVRLKEYWDMFPYNEYAFCTLDRPYSKINVSCLEIAIRELGEIADVPKCHPHRFRRTTATTAIKKGMSILDVQRMLGHESLDTTKIYLDLDDSDLKYQHQKYL